MIDTNELSDTELNRAMFYLYFDYVIGFVESTIGQYVDIDDGGYCDDGKGIEIPIHHWETEYTVNFLEGYLAWELVMPLAVEKELGIHLDKDEAYVFSKFREYQENSKNPLHAICCVLVQIAMEGK